MWVIWPDLNCRGLVCIQPLLAVLPSSSPAAKEITLKKTPCHPNIHPKCKKNLWSTYKYSPIVDHLFVKWSIHFSNVHGAAPFDAGSKFDACCKKGKKLLKIPCNPTFALTHKSEEKTTHQQWTSGQLNGPPPSYSDAKTEIPPQQGLRISPSFFSFSSHYKNKITV